MLNSIADVMILFTETSAQHGRVCRCDWEGEQPPVHQLCQAGAGDAKYQHLQVDCCYIMTISSGAGAALHGAHEPRRGGGEAGRGLHQDRGRGGGGGRQQGALPRLSVHAGEEN